MSENYGQNSINKNKVIFAWGGHEKKNSIPNFLSDSRRQQTPWCTIGQNFHISNFFFARAHPMYIDNNVMFFVINVCSYSYSNCMNYYAILSKCGQNHNSVAFSLFFFYLSIIEEGIVIQKFWDFRIFFKFDIE
jgi:hypothetical protein